MAEVRKGGRGLAAAVMLIAIAATLISSPASATSIDASKAPPDWYSKDLHRRVIAAGTSGVPVPPAAGISALAFAGIRPGTWMVSPNWCTLNFIFNASGSLAAGGPFYAGTARHCVTKQDPADLSDGSLGGFDPNDQVIGKPVVAVVSPSPGTPPSLVDIGTVTHASAGMSVGGDFALVRIRSDLEALISPSMSEVGGPTASSSGSQAEPVVMIGHGMVIGTGGTARLGATSSFNSKYPYGYGMVIAAGPGDSGSPVRNASGAAVGSVTHIGVVPEFATADAFGTRVAYVRDNWGLVVVTCSALTPWPWLGCPR